MKKIYFLTFSLICFTLLLPPLLHAEDFNETAYQNRFLLKAGTILNSEGKGDCLIFPYYDVRTVDGKKQVTEISIENFGEYGITARLRFREWSRGREVFVKDIWIPSNGTWNGKIEMDENGTNAIITSFDNMIWRYNSKTFFLSNPLSGGFPFSTRSIRKVLGESTLYGFFEVIGEEKTSPDNFNGKVNRLAKIERDCPNQLKGKAFIMRVEDGATMAYDAVAIGNFSRGQGSLFRSPTSPYPRLDTCEDTLDQLEFQLSKSEIYAPYAVNPSDEEKTSLIIAYPTKFFHYLNGSRISQVNNPFEALTETAGEVIETALSEQGQKFVDSSLTLPYSVNVIGLYREYIGKPFGIDNVPMQTYSSELGETTLSSDNLSQRLLIPDYEYYKEGRFMMYRGLPAAGLILQESRSSSQLNATLTPVEYSTQWVSSNVETISIPTTPSGPSSGFINESYSFTTNGSSSSFGHPIQYLFDWGDGTDSDWLPVGTTSASKTWTEGGVFTVRARARCATHTDIVSNWSDGLVVYVEQVSAPTLLNGPTMGVPNTPYTYSTGGALSNLGHSIQYFFDWGDSTDSNWLPVGTTSATKSWAIGGEYKIKARARCATHTSVISDFTSELTVKIEKISTPSTPVGPNKGFPGDTFTYMTGGATSNIGHPIEYFFDWGDGTNSGWQLGTSASKTWAIGGTFAVKVRARCVLDTSVFSEWSSALTVNIELITVTTPTGPTTGSPNTIYTYAASGSSNIGDPVQIRLIFSDGSESGWLPVGTNSFPKSWSSGGIFTVMAKARCSIHTSNESAWSSPLTVTVTNPAPTLTSVSPNSGNRGGPPLDVVLNGTNFINGATTISFGADITVNAANVFSSMGIAANITIGAAAATGPRSVSVTNSSPGGGTATLANGFTVN